ncbi:MAG: hypothetical protein DBX47_00500 [Clostridiales bacterium]|nr:MAG: hypothetical protein DBX47_00500 [Clostridiales bacterium]
MKKSRKIMFNEDAAHHFGEYACAHKMPTPELEKEFIYQYKDTQITDYLINLNYMLSLAPSKVMMSYAEKHYQKVENGKDVDYSDNIYYKCFIENGYDVFAHWIQLLREINIRPWLSFRMNDCHDSFADQSFMLDDYFHEHKELRRVSHHKPTEYYDNCFDFGKKPVRDKMYNYIQECLERYDVDGIDLDFMREQFCFSIGGEYAGRGVMINYIREIKELVDRFAKIRNKNIEISIRIPQDPTDCFYEGFDVVTMAKEKLIDVIVPSPRWCPTDNDLPIEFWKNILSPYNVELAAGLELILQTCTGGELFWLQTHETAMAAAYQYLSAGADCIYFFNFMRTNATDFNDPSNEVMYQDLFKWDNYQHLFRNAGDKESSQKCIRRHIPTFHDTVPAWRERYKPFPAVCNDPNKYLQVRARTGNILPTDKVKIVLGCSYNPENSYKDTTEMKDIYAYKTKLPIDETPLPLDNFEVYINSNKIICSSTEDIRPFFTRKKGYVFDIDDNSIFEQVNMIEIAVKNNGLPFNIDFLEIRVIPEKA